MSDPGWPVQLAPFETGIGTFRNGVTGQISTAEYKARTLYDYGDKTGYDTPGWPNVVQDNPYQRVRIRGKGVGMVPARGSNPTNGDSYTGSAPISYLSNGQPTGTVVVNPFTTGGGNDAYPPEILRLLENRLLDKINKQKFNAAQFIAERRQLTSLVRSTANKIATSVMMLRRRNWVDARRALLGSSRNRLGNSAIGGASRNLGGIPERWLELQYGWKPLLGDIHGAAEELADLVTDVDPPVMTCRVGAKASKGTKSYTAKRVGLFPIVKWERVSSETQGYAFVECKLASDFGQTLARTGITNPYQLAWELLPWSFVVDWFLPVGRYLTQLNADVGLRFSRGWWCQKTTDTWVAKIENGTVKSGSLTINWSPGTYYSVEGMRFDRFKLSSLPTPSLPSLKSPLSLVHAANALSLMAVSFGKPKNTFDFMAPRQGLPRFR